MSKSSLFRLKDKFFITGRKWILFLFDFVLATVVFVAGDLLFYVFTSRPPVSFKVKLLYYSVFIIIGLFMRMLIGIYSSVWRYANSFSYTKLLLADSVSGFAFLAITWANNSKYLTGWTKITMSMLVFILTLSSRFAYQMLHSHRNIILKPKDGIKNVAIIGAGLVGVSLANELSLNQNSHYNPFCFVDADKSKVDNEISGIKVIGAGEDIIDRLIEMPLDEIIIAIPSLSGEEKQNLYKYYKQTGLPIRIYDFAFDSALGADQRIVRDIRIEDLLFREPVNLIKAGDNCYYRGKVVLVTGGGGSIGSEICRQLSICKVKKLIVLDIYENNAFDIQQELKAKYPDIDVTVEIASVADPEILESVFRIYKPEIVFHAAAHKHVPLMETSSAEAIRNNVFGAKHTADLAEEYGVERFIFVSTDKAVNPTNIMGATKRVCEHIVLSRKDSDTSFCAVRFGNVLGSNGSVIPTFRQQIDKGGPVTLTDKRVTRYFMTIPEATQLVMQAGIMAEQGQLFVLDMGKPVRILDLAENLIRLSGFTPYTDIDIIEIGLRPGEKLYEELLINSGKLKTTSNKKIFIETDISMNREEVDIMMGNLSDALKEYRQSLDSEVIKSALKKVVPTYKDPATVNTARLSTLASTPHDKDTPD